MKKLLTEWRKYLKEEEDDWAAEFGGFSDEERVLQRSQVTSISTVRLAGGEVGW